jgi:LCP family protein required for cell wall assembly
VTIPGVSNGKKDKLTHAGIYGVDASIAALENLYDIEIPFYAKVNFTSVEKIVNVLGGVDVYSEYSFTTNDGYYVKSGMNHFDGKQALSFARERYHVPGGDETRGKNQQAVIVAMIKKIISPAILTKASGIIDSVSDNVETNISQKQIQELLKMQLNEGGSWSIYSTAVTGPGGMDYTYSIPGTPVYVMYPDSTSVGNAKDLLDKVEQGEKIDGSVVAE